MSITDKETSENVSAFLEVHQKEYLAKQDPALREKYAELFKTETFQDILDRALTDVHKSGSTSPLSQQNIDRKEKYKLIEDKINRLKERQSYIEHKRVEYTQIKDDLQRNLEESRARSERRKRWLSKYLTTTGSLPDLGTSDQQAAPSQPTVESHHTHQSENPTSEPAPSTWEADLTTYVLDMTEKYPIVSITPYLTETELGEFFPTEESRAQLRVRQEQMQSEITERIQSFLSEDTSNRKEKLSIIRQTLSENWSPDIAEGVLERL